jgi:hypothetical protein
VTKHPPPLNYFEAGKTGNFPTPKTVPIGLPMDNSVPKPRRAITEEISKVRKRRKEGKEERKGKGERIVNPS